VGRQIGRQQQTTPRPKKKIRTNTETHKTKNKTKQKTKPSSTAYRWPLPQSKAKAQYKLKTDLRKRSKTVNKKSKVKGLWVGQTKHLCVIHGIPTQTSNASCVATTNGGATKTKKKANQPERQSSALAC
jgi:hypothetical protein